VSPKPITSLCCGCLLFFFGAIAWIQAENRGLDSSGSALPSVVAAESESRSAAPATEMLNRAEPVHSPVPGSVLACAIGKPLLWIRGHRIEVFAEAALCGALLAAWAFSVRRRSKKEARRFMTTMRLSLMDPEVQRACLHIEKSYTDLQLTPAAICAAIVTGEPFLNALFDRELGMSITGYIDQVRIHHAKLIATRDPTIPPDSIAPLVGFPDGAAFEAKFEALTGSSFTAYCPEKRTNS
jgi:AraC-like DNA-binding protein